MAAAATVVGSAWHGVMAVHHGGVLAGLMLFMAAVCLVCAVHLWSGPARTRAWITVIAMDLAMVLTHLALLPLAAAGAHEHASPGGEATAASPEAMLLVPLGNLLVIGAAAYRTYRAGMLAAR